MRALALSFAALAAVPLRAQADADLAALCRAIGPAITGDLAPGKPRALPPAARLAKIDRAAPAAAGTAAATMFDVKHAWPDDEDAEARLARVPVGDGAGHQVVLIASLDGQIRGGAVLDKDGALDAKASAFAVQLVGRNVPPLDAAVPRIEIQKRLSLIATNESAAASAGALVLLRRDMVEQSVPATNVMQALERGDAPPPDQVAAMRGTYEAMRSHAGRLALILDIARYNELVKRVLSHLDDIGGAADAKARQAVHKQLKGDCRDCHTLHSGKFDGDFEEYAANELQRLGVGGQPFLVGYDVAPAGLDVAAAQPIADAFARAALLLDAARR